jgi:simple sugar transport system permease protein
MMGVSNFARELIWGALLIFVMLVNTRLVYRPRRAKPAPSS